MAMRHIQALSKQNVVEMLRQAGVNPTSQRVEVAHTLFCSCEHLSADEIMQRVNAEYPQVSKATVYNTLGILAQHQLVREVIVEPGKVFYDANSIPHHHFYHMDSGRLEDIPSEHLTIQSLPPLPEGTVLDSVDVVIRVRERAMRLA